MLHARFLYRTSVGNLSTWRAVGFRSYWSYCVLKILKEHLIKTNLVVDVLLYIIEFAGVNRNTQWISLCDLACLSLTRFWTIWICALFFRCQSKFWEYVTLAWDNVSSAFVVYATIIRPQVCRWHFFLPLHPGLLIILNWKCGNVVTQLSTDNLFL